MPGGYATGKREGSFDNPKLWIQKWSAHPLLKCCLMQTFLNFGEKLPYLKWHHNHMEYFQKIYYFCPH